jgi:hypothetical protein
MPKGESMSPRTSKTSHASKSTKSVTKSTKKSVKKTTKKSSKTTVAPATTRKKAAKASTTPKPAKKTPKKAAVSSAKKDKPTRKAVQAKKPAEKVTKKSPAKTPATKKATSKQGRKSGVVTVDTIKDPVITATLTETSRKPGGETKPGAEGEKLPKTRGPRKKRESSKSLTEEFLEEGAPEAADEEEVNPNLVDLDPLDGPVVIDPELKSESVAKSNSPDAPTAKSGKLMPRQQTCSNCSESFAWISTDGFCFNCLKQRIAVKRNDETFGHADSRKGKK